MTATRTRSPDERARWAQSAERTARAQLGALTALRARRADAEVAAADAERAVAAARERVDEVERQRRRGECGQGDVDRAYVELSNALDRWLPAHDQQP